MEAYNRMAAEDPSYPARLQQLEALIQQMKQQGVEPMAGNIMTIPVVVHIVYRTTAENISDAQVQSQITVLNEDFRRLNADGANTLPAFLGVAADAEIEFCLAKRDPNGAATTGITRTQTTVTSWSTNDNVKRAANGGKDPWNTTQYLNLWVCNLGGGLLGYAQFPGGTAATDGVVINYQYFGRNGSAQAPYALGRTATHEIGHYLNLRHIWGDGGCGVDDGVTDTPVSGNANYGCPLNAASCGTQEMVQNYMDYTDDDCMNIYTQGQKTRMRAAITASRPGLLTSLGCVPPNAPPVADFKANKTKGCPGLSVTFTDLTTNTPTNWVWTFTGGTPASFTGQNPPAVTYAAAGTYAVTLVASNSFGSDTETKTAYITISSAAATLPFVESFENANVLTQWDVENPDASTTWAIQQITGTTPGNKAAYVNCFNYTATGQRDGLISPLLNFSGFTSVSCYFEHAYRRKTNPTGTDSLIVYVSTNCGQTYQRVAAYGENGQGVFATMATSGTNFIPAAANDWCFGNATNAVCNTIDLSAFAGQSQVRVKFECYNRNLNNLFIDNINIQGVGSPVAPVADFTANVTSGCSPLTVTFSDASAGAPTSWAWDVDNNGTTDYTSQTVSHTYAAAGTYTVKLTVTNSAGTDSETKTSFITVTAGIGTVDGGSNSPLCAGQALNLTASTISGATYAWTGPNGFTSAVQNPSIASPTTAATGLYIVTATKNGCSAKDTVVVQVAQATAATPGSNSPVCLGQTIQLTADTLNGVTYSWTGPNGFTSGVRNPTILNATAANSGIYTVTTGINGCSSTPVTISVTVSNAGGVALPFIETFENGFTAQNWTINNPDGAKTWEIQTTGGETPGTQSARVNFFEYTTVGQRDYLDSRLLSFAGYSTVNLKFDHAYRRYDQTVHDSLIVSISADCGQTFTRLAAYAENGTGVFASAPLSQQAFVPAAVTDWCFDATNTLGNICKQIDLTPYAGNPAVKIRFESYNDYGNNLYLDNINIDGTACTQTSTFTTSAATVCTGQNVTVTFTGTAGTAATYNWDFNGATVVSGSGKGPYVLNWPIAGTKDIKLIVAEGTCTSPQTLLSVTVNAAPTATINNAPASACVNAPVALSAATVTGATYSWNFGGGTATPGGNNANQSVTFATSGTKTVTLTVIANGCTSAVATKTITINAIPATPTISAANTTVCANSAVALSTTAVTGATYVWNFDGGTATPGGSSANQSVSWATAGTKNVTLTFVVNGCSSAVATKTISVGAGLPPITITPSATSVCVFDGVDLNGTVVNGATYQWNLDGGQPPFNPNTAFQPTNWSTPGVKNVTLTVIANGCTSAVVTQQITVSAVPATPTISAANTTVCANGALALSTTVVTGATYAWNFDGGTATPGGSSANQSVSWSTAGTKNITLNVVVNGCSSAVATKTITVGAGLPNLTLTASTNATCVSQTVSLNATPVTGATYLWDFDGGMGGFNPNSPDQPVTWSTSGTKNVTLTVIANGCTSQVLTKTITVFDAIPSVSISANQTTVCGGAPVTLTATAVAGATYAWSFDGGTSTSGAGATQVVTWPTSGTKNVTLTVTANGCSSNVATQTITINPGPPAITVTETALTACVGQTVSFSATNVTGVTYVWDLDGGMGGFFPGSPDQPVHWMTAGVKTVTLTVIAQGCTSLVYTQQINIVNALTATITSSAVTACANGAVTLTANVVAGATYTWDFDGGVSTSNPNDAVQNVSWPTNGTKNVTLIIDANGCMSNSATQTITVSANGGSANFTATQTTVCEGSTIQLDATPTTGATYNWTFNGGVNTPTGGSDASQLVSWTSPGVKTVTLVVSSAGCVSAPFSQTITVGQPIGAVTITASSSTVCENVGLNLSAPVIANAVYQWDFDGGVPTTAGNTANETVSWAGNGSKVVSLTIIADGCTSAVAVQNIIVIKGGAMPDITANQSGCLGETVNFQTTPVSGVAYIWSFDGGTATPGGSSPTQDVVWSSAGTKTVTLITESGGCQSQQQTLTFTVSEAPANVQIITNDGINCTGQAVSIVGLPEIAGATYTWTFDGGVQTGGTPSQPSVVWSSGGGKTVTLVVSVGGCASAVQSTQINVSESPAAAQILSPADTIGVNETIAILGNPSGANYDWSFDGGVATPGGNAQNQVVIWDTPGLKTVVLSVSQNGCGSANDTISIQVLPTNSVDDPIARAFGLQIYPNPNNGRFSIGFNAQSTQIAKVQVIDPLGRVIFNYDADPHPGANTLAIDLGNLSAGVYTVELEQNGHTATKKFIVR